MTTIQVVLNNLEPYKGMHGIHIIFLAEIN